MSLNEKGLEKIYFIDIIDATKQSYTFDILRFL